MVGNDTPIDGIIYKTTNILNGKWYIGKDQNNNPEYLGSGKLLSRAIAKYGKSGFRKEILKNVDTIHELNKLEIFFIEQYNAINDENSYNIAGGGHGGNTIAGFSEEERKNFGYRMKEIYITMPADKKQRRARKISQALKNKPKSQSHKNNISKAKTGIKESPEIVDKKRLISKKLYEDGIISPPKNNWTGRTHTKESKIKISKSKKGVKNIKKRLFSPEEQLHIRELYRQGIRTGIIAEMYSTTGPTILRYVREIILDNTCLT